MKDYEHIVKINGNQYTTKNQNGSETTDCYHSVADVLCNVQDKKIDIYEAMDLIHHISEVRGLGTHGCCY